MHWHTFAEFIAIAIPNEAAQLQEKGKKLHRKSCTSIFLHRQRKRKIPEQFFSSETSTALTAKYKFWLGCSVLHIINIRSELSFFTILYLISRVVCFLILYIIIRSATHMFFILLYVLSLCKCIKIIYDHVHNIM